MSGYLWEKEGVIGKKRKELLAMFCFLTMLCSLRENSLYMWACKGGKTFPRFCKCPRLGLKIMLTKTDDQENSIQMYLI